MLDYYLEPDVMPEGPESFGYVHEDSIPDMDHLKDHVLGIVESVYMTGDVAMLESSLDEICGLLDIKSNPGIPLVERKGNFNMMKQYLGYQRETIDFLQGRV